MINLKELINQSKEIGKIVFYEDYMETDNETYLAYSSFHATKIYEHTEDDNYFAGIRANHFAIEVGYVEYAPKDTISWSVEEPNFILVTANHKGTRISKLLEINP
jgi:hypothetical protein